MRVLLTGSNGFLGQKFSEKLSHYSLVENLLGISKSANRNPYLSPDQFRQVDLENTEEMVATLEAFKPTHILHTAAMTSVEACEQDKEAAYRINVGVTKALAAYCKRKGIHLTFLSTDFVFDGKNGPYRESDPTKAVNFYGQTKIEAEEAIVQSAADAAILRTILVYGAIPDKGRSNLVLWAKNQLEQGKEITVVVDQWRMPTWVDDLADACYLAMQQRASGIFHISGEEMMSIMEAVKLVADTWNLNTSKIHPITAEAIGQHRNRPRTTGFVLDKAKSFLKYQPTPFVASLHAIKKQLEEYKH